MWGVSNFYALEENPGRDGFHVHALWCDCFNKSRRDLWQKWFDRYGRNRIEPVNNRDDVSDWCVCRSWCPRNRICFPEFLGELSGNVSS
jgi:hypothetical protein